MSKTQRYIFGVSIALNVILIVYVLITVIKINFVKEQILLTEVRNNLVELEGLIGNQIDKQWSESNLVTTELGDVMNGILLGIRSGQQLGILSEKDKDILNDLYYKLNQFPKDALYSFSNLTQQDKENFEELRKSLCEVGLGLNIQMSSSIKSFIEQAHELETNIKTPLN